MPKESNIHQCWRKRYIAAAGMRRFLELEALPADPSTAYPNACVRLGFHQPKNATFPAQLVTSVKTDFCQMHWAPLRKKKRPLVGKCKKTSSYLAFPTGFTTGQKFQTCYDVVLLLSMGQTQIRRNWRNWMVCTSISRVLTRSHLVISGARDSTHLLLRRRK